MAKAAGGLSPKALRQNFAEIHPALTANEAVAEASRCLYCYDAPCTRACPTHIDVPGFIHRILHRDAVGAAEVILDANIFGGSCARVCPTEVLCEGACVDNTLLNDPIQIGRLQRFACDSADERKIDFHQPGPDTGKSIAVVGAGPAGLTCAHDLRKHGHRVVVFEAGKVAGGLNTLGIAAYKISTGYALSEVRRIQRMGLDLRLRKLIDGAALARLLGEYDAVFLGVGLGATARLNIPGEDKPGVWEALEFIYQTHSGPLSKARVGRRVIVIGGGNTAIDAAVAARKLGAEEVTIAYRRNRDAMPAFHHEYELAVAEGVHFEWLARPLRIVLSRGRTCGVRFARNRLQGTGRQARLIRVPRSDFTLPADMVIKALGQVAWRDLLKAVPKLKIARDGNVEVDSATHATSVPRLFAGGDCVNGGKEVVDAVQAGKIAAAGIHRMLSE